MEKQHNQKHVHSDCHRMPPLHASNRRQWNLACKIDGNLHVDHALFSRSISSFETCINETPTKCKYEAMPLIQICVV